ncbi:hypothetical protein LIER_00546 [Lithospermum erythrorhizon]|uniref:MBD domain-containing protein n=1 Tax=Lithospermum erythrorhizon TaxID=34254 RepID=A0AAV3NM87_LITER
MVAGKSLEELPLGWKEVVGLKNGRKSKYYLSEEDGKKLYSKLAVMRYVNMKIDGNDTPQPQTETGCNSTPQLQSEIDYDNTPLPPSETECNKTPQPWSEMDCNNSAHQQNEHGEAGFKSVDSGSARTSEQLPWLPPGWITEVKSKKSGATYKIYIDSATGSKFYSKPQVLQYLGTLSVGDSVKENNNTFLEKSSPDGEVCQHQETWKTESCVSEKETSSGNKHSAPTACSNAFEVGSVDGLPVGWSKEIRTKDIGGKIRKYVYYKDPVSCFAFYSKKDALRYVETGDSSRCKIRPMKIEEPDLDPSEVHAPSVNIERCLEKNDLSEQYALGKSQNSISREEEINKLFEDIVETVKSDQVESTAVDGLPPGWIKELKSRKDGKRKDTFYVDPVSGYMFQSKLDALRYIETGDIIKCAIKPKKRGTDDNESTQIVYRSSPVDQRYSLESSIGKVLVSGDLNDGKLNLDTRNLKVEAESSKRMQENSSSITSLTNNVAEVTPKKSLRRRERKTRPEGSEQKNVRTASSIGTVVSVKQEFTAGMVEHKIETLPASGSYSKRLSQCVPGRKSKRLAGIQPETPLNLQLSERSLRSTTRKSREGESNASAMEILNDVPSVPGQHVQSKLELGSDDTFYESKFAKDMDEQKYAGSRPKMEQPVHGRASKRLAGCQPEMPTNLQLSERSLRAAMRMASENEATILPMITMNYCPSVQPQLQQQPFHPNLCVADANASHEQKLPNDNLEQKNRNTSAGLRKPDKRKSASTSSRTSKQPASQTVHRRTSKRPVAATSGRSSKRLAGNQFDPSPVTTTSSVPVVLPQSPQSEPLPGTATHVERTFSIDRKHIFDGTLEPLNSVPAPGVADIVSMVVESISKMDEIEMDEQPLVNSHAVSDVKIGQKNMEASPEIKTVKEETGIQLNDKPEFDNSISQNTQSSYLSVVDSWSDPCLDFAFKTLTGAISLEDTLSYQGYSQPQVNTYPVNGNGHFGQSGSHNLVNSQQSTPYHFQDSLAYRGSSPAQSSTPSVFGRNGSFAQSGTHNNLISFQQYTPTSSTSSWQQVQVEQPRIPSIPPGFECVPPYRGIRNNSDTRNTDYMRDPGTNK